jgi:hypothetical protein
MVLLLCAAMVAAATARAVDLAPPPPPSAWKLRGGGLLQVLDGPGSGRYTQVRIASGSGVATIVWNGEPGLRLARCTDRRCSATTAPRTLLNGSGHPVLNPRFLRMELAPGDWPVLAFATAGTTQATVMHCHDPLCLTAVTTVLTTAPKIRHCDLLLDPVVVGRMVVTFGLSMGPSAMPPKDCVTCSGFRDELCQQTNYTAFSECNCGGGGCDCSSCCAGQALSECCSVVPHASGCQTPPTPTPSNRSTLLAFHTTGLGGAWLSTTVASAAAAFGVNESTGLPTGGLEMPCLVNRDPQRCDRAVVCPPSARAVHMVCVRPCQPQMGARSSVLGCGAAAPGPHPGCAWGPGYAEPSGRRRRWPEEQPGILATDGSVCDQ